MDVSADAPAIAAAVARVPDAAIVDDPEQLGTPWRHLLARRLAGQCDELPSRQADEEATRDRGQESIDQLWKARGPTTTCRLRTQLCPKQESEDERAGDQQDAPAGREARV